MNGIYKLLVFVSITLLLSACSDNTSQPANTGKYAPALNSHPKYFVTIKGTIDPNIKHGIKLKIISIFTSTNPRCQYVVNSFKSIFSGIFQNSSVARHIRQTIILTSKDGKFYKKIPLDKYKQNYCKWKINSIAYAPEPNNGYAPIVTASFSEKKFYPSVKKLRSDNWSCISNRCEVMINQSVQYNSEMPISSKKNYSYSVYLWKSHG